MDPGVLKGTPAVTTRGFGPEESRQVADLIARTLDGVRTNPDDNSATEKAVKADVLELCRRFPIYGQ